MANEFIMHSDHEALKYIQGQHKLNGWNISTHSTLLSSTSLESSIMVRMHYLEGIHYCFS